MLCADLCRFNIPWLVAPSFDTEMMTYMLSPIIRSFVAYAHVLVFVVLMCSIDILDFGLEKSGVVFALPVDSLSQYNVSRFPFLDE